jgi:lipopolysaccharide transport system permease protein
VETIPTKQWTEEITPKTSLFDIRLSEVWRYRDLLGMFVKRDFIATYKQTVLGPVWHFVQPILTTIMYIIVFGRIARIPIPDGIPSVAFYMSGITMWNYFSSCLNGTSNTFTGNAAIFGKVYFPRLVIPLSVIISNIVKFGIQFLLLLAVLIYYGVNTGHFHFGVSWILIPFLILLMAGLGLGFGILISSLTTKYRDFTVMLTIGLQLLMYASPIVYPASYVRNISEHGYLIDYNPLTAIVEGFRYAIFGNYSFHLSSLGYSFAWMIVILLLGVVVFNRTEKSFMDTV